LLDAADLESLREAVNLCGSLPRVEHIDVTEIIDALKFDKKSVQGQINWVLLDKVGSPKIVEGRLISKRILRRSISDGLRASWRQKERSH
jgi:3-dehydroquinate synthetase